jgi:hypothetical protein
VRLPTVDGIDPNRQLLYSSRMVSLVRLPIVDGIDPVRLLLYSQRPESPVRLPTLGGMVPLIDLSSRLIKIITPSQVIPVQVHLELREEVVHPESPRSPISVEAMKSSRKASSVWE